MLETARNEMKTKIEDLSSKCFEIAMEQHPAYRASFSLKAERWRSRESWNCKIGGRRVQELNECVLEERSNATYTRDESTRASSCSE